MATANELHECKLKIKQWEHEFAKAHGRPPAKADMKANPEIGRLYKMYNLQRHKKERHADSDDETPVSLTAELGPTPQANGRVRSIFEMTMSPPQSSPSKPPAEFKTPTKAASQLSFIDVTPRQNTPKESVMARLQSIMTPTKPGVLSAETPAYLGKSKLFSFSTPSRTPAPFQESPSPLKLQRASSFGRSITEIYAETQSFEVIHELAQQLNPTDEDDDAENEEPAGDVPRKKARTQKRTTRRWKIKPKANEESTVVLGVDIHQELKELQERERPKREPEPSLELDDDAVPISVAQGVKRKPGVVSGNFQRLKINDPRAKKFKQRMRR